MIIALQTVYTRDKFMPVPAVRRKNMRLPREIIVPLSERQKSRIRPEIIRRVNKRTRIRTKELTRRVVNWSKNPRAKVPKCPRHKRTRLEPVIAFLLGPILKCPRCNRAEEIPNIAYSTRYSTAS
jgi:hypothetical protein